MNEGDKAAEYTLKFIGTKRGLWIGTEPPRGMCTSASAFIICIYHFLYIYFMYFLEDKGCQKVFISPFTWKTHKFNSFYSHTGSILKKHLHHSHFTGTIQVMKAVATHLVLTFCERNELFTIILTRTKSIPVDVSTLSR